MDKEKNNDDQDGDQQDKDEIDIMEMLHKKKMYTIEQCFQRVGKGLDLYQFVKVMLEHLEYDKNDQEKREKIALALVDLFREIDVNGDETMEWEEFSDHIISLGLLRNDRSFKNVIKNYYPSETIIDKEKHETGIEKVYYFDKLKQLIVLERDSPRFKVYRANDCDLICEVNAHKCAVLAAEFIQNHHMVATSSNDLTINFWDSNSYSLKQIVSVPEIQLCMRYAKWKTQNEPSFLYTGGSDAIIHIYDANTLKEKGTMSGWNPFFKKDSQQYGHAGPIGDILPIQSQLTLVTAGLDSNICLWDVVTHSPKKELKGHEKGVYSLDWSDWSTMNQCLISAGLDHEAFVWNTYVKEKIFLLRGHNHPLIGVKCLPDTPQVVTADINGMVKIWDVRNFLCMQTFNVPVEELNTFVLTSAQKKRIILGSRRLYYYEYDEPKDQKLTDEKQCIRVLYNDVMLCFITLHPESIKVWDARNGYLISVFRELSHAELTCCILDNRQRKLFVGDAEGRIFTVNIKNGARLKKFEKHSQAITDLGHWTSTNQIGKPEDDGYEKDDIRRVISASRETTVNIHDEDSQDSLKSCRYKMKQHKDSINSVSLKLGTEYLASGSSDGNVILTNLITYRQENFGKPSGEEIKQVKFLYPFHCLAASDSVGNVFFYGIAPSKLKNKLFYQKAYKTNPQTNNSQEEKFPVTYFNHFYLKGQFNILLLADEFGYVTGWNLENLMEKLKRKKEEKRKNLKIMEQMQGAHHKDKEDDGDNPLITQINLGQDDENFEENDVPKQNFLKIKAHDDQITWIEVMVEQKAFATCGFDCQVHLWNIETKEKIGSLILGHDSIDNGWRFEINVEERRQKAIDEAKIIMVECQDVEIASKQKQKGKDPSTAAGQGDYSKSQKILQALHDKEHKGEVEKNKQREKAEEARKIQQQTLSKKQQTYANAARIAKFMKGEYLPKMTEYTEKYKKRQNGEYVDIQYQEFSNAQTVQPYDNQQKDIFLNENDEEDEEDENDNLQDLLDFKNQNQVISKKTKKF